MVNIDAIPMQSNDDYNMIAVFVARTVSREFTYLYVKLRVVSQARARGNLSKLLLAT